MLKISAISLAIAFSLLAYPVQTRQLEASQAWEGVLTAKGGSQLLHAVRGFAVSLHQVVPPNWNRTDVIGEGSQEFVTQRHDRVWRATDYRPAAMGLTVEIWNRPLRRNWIAQDGGSAIERTWDDDSLAGMESRIEELELLYFGETAELRAVPVQVRSPGASGEVEVRTQHFASVRFLIDPSTRLPRRVTMTPFVKGADGRRTQRAVFDIVYQIDAYQIVAGISVPKEIRNHGNVVVMVNPAIDEKLFFSEPSGVHKFDAWKAYLK